MNYTLRTASFATLAVFLFLFGSAPEDARAQFLVGGGLVYGTEISSLGIQASGNYAILGNDGLRLAADLTFFFPDEETVLGVEVDQSYFTINLNGNYIFHSEDGLKAYALGGLNIGILSSEASGGGFSSSETNSEVGINLGAGVEYKLAFAILYGEAKFVISEFDQFVIGGGLRFPVGGD